MMKRADVEAAKCKCILLVLLVLSGCQGDLWTKERVEARVAVEWQETVAAQGVQMEAVKFDRISLVMTTERTYEGFLYARIPPYMYQYPVVVRMALDGSGFAWETTGVKQVGKLPAEAEEAAK